MPTVSTNIGGTNYTSTNSKTPYREMYDQYATQQKAIRDAYQKQLDTDLANNQNEINSQYNNSARQNYVNYMQQRKNLPSELNAQGINGGASESSILRLGTNYGSNVAENESGRNSSLAALAQTYANKKAEYDEEYDNKLQSAYLTMLENQQKYEQEQREKDLQYFANSISGRFSSVGEYESLIRQLRASNDPNKDYKIALAQQAMNALAMSQKSSGGGGGRGRSYGYGGGYSSGYGTDTSGGTVSAADADAASRLLAGAISGGLQGANAGRSVRRAVRSTYGTDRTPQSSRWK